METTRICEICQQEIEYELWDFHRQTEKTALERILEEYPHWANEDGTPSEKCEEHYRLFAVKIGE